MDWVKRNLFLVVGGAAALIAVGGSGFFFYTKIAADQDAQAKLDQIQSEYDGLRGKNPFPSKDNLEAAREQQKKLRDFLGRSQGHFGRFMTNLPGGFDFGPYLAQNLAELQRQAAEMQVKTPTNYAFSFAVENEASKFDPAALTKLVSQVEDVRGLCEIVFQARVNELIIVQRAKASTNDNAVEFGGPNINDFISRGAFVTNPSPAAILSPYQVTFRCSSEELASIMECLARAPNGYNVKWVKVDNGEVPRTEEETPTTAPPRMMNPYFRGMNPEMARRYGMYGRYGPRPPTPSPDEVASVTPSQPRKTGVGRVLQDRLLKVTLNVEVIKLLASK